MRLVTLLLLISVSSFAQVGRFVSEKKMPVSKVGGFTSTDRYYTTTGPDYNLTGFSFWTVIEPTVNLTTSNIQFIFGKSSWNQANAGWGFRSFQGSYNHYIDCDSHNATVAQKFARGVGVSTSELGYMQVLHCVIRNNVIYLYKNGMPTGYEGVNGPGVSKTTNTGTIPSFGIGFGGFAGAQSLIKPFDGSIISAGICSSTGLSDAQVAAHYTALLNDPYATATGATNAWKAPDAGATWTDFIGGVVATRYGAPTVTSALMPFYKQYDINRPFGITAPVLPQLTGTIRVMTIGDSRTAGGGSIRYVPQYDMANKGMTISWVGKYPNPSDFYIAQTGYSEQSNGMSGRSTRDCIEGVYNFPPLSSELVTHNPDVAIVWFGQNSPDTQDYMKDAIIELLGIIHSTKPNCRILVLSELNGVRQGATDQSTLASAAKFKDYNNWLPGAISRLKNQGYIIDCVKIDLSLLWDSSSDWADTLHPTAVDISTGQTTYGQVKIGQTIWPALRYICGYN